MNDTRAVAPQLDSHPDYMARPYNAEPYDAVKPQPDNDEIASKGERVVLYHRRYGVGMHQAVLTIAPHGLQVAGWVIGLIRR